MKYLTSNALKAFLRVLVILAALMPTLPTLAQTSPFPSQPLLSIGATAKPNLLLLMDNSGSMGFTFVPDNFRNSYSSALAATSAYQSPDANRLYYDPRIQYFPRVNSTSVSLGSATEQSALTRTQNWHGNAAGIFYTENCPNPPGGVCSAYAGRPQTTADNSTGVFSNNLIFNLCTARDAAGICIAITPNYTIPAPATSNTFATNAYPVKSAARTDCVNPLMVPSGTGPLPLMTPNFTRCTWQDERQNALNWSEYYSTRMEAAKTSIGIAFQDPSFQNNFRLGYGWMNQNTSSTREPTGTMIRRGVRPFTDSATTAVPNEKTQFYNWLYNLNAQGGTSSNHLLEAAGTYFLRTDNGGPWASTPANTPTVTTGDATVHLACRRNSAIMFSDGAYSDVTTAPNRPGNVDSGVFTGLNNTTHINPTNSVPFVFSSIPVAGASYIAYPDNNVGTMSDRAAAWWIQDLRPDLPNIIPPVDGNPAFWQHMVFYSIGLGIRGNVTPLQIANYNNSYVRGNAITPLNWGAPSDATTNINNVDDFVHAGYAGQGKSFSVSSPNEIKDAFLEAISRATQAGGSNAGVAVSDTNNNLSTLAGELKYVPSYNLVDSTGNIKAYTLGANGNVVGGLNATPTWIASLNIPPEASRNLVTLSSSGPINLTASSATAYAALPTDIRTALGSNGNSDVVNYLRGSVSGINASGQNLRIRNSNMGSVVNSPPAYIRGELNMGYTDTFVATTTSIPGIEKYESYHKAKNDNGLGVLFAAANDGILHAMNPATGREIMGYMPRSALPKMAAFSIEPYTHDYVLDGPVNEGDIYDGTNWKSIAFGTGGRGGRYVYALNVPVQGTPTGALTPPAMAASDLKWEINTSTPGFGSLGYVLNPPQSGVMSNGRSVTVFGNGYYSASNQASLFIADALTGEFIQEISTGVGTAASPNSMGGITLVRKGRVIVAALGGDSQGNMWKFDLRSPGSGTVDFSGQPLYTVPGNRPFSGAPAWRPLNSGMLVVAATGLLNTSADATDVGTQTIYGVLDKNAVGANSTISPLGTLADSMLQLQTSSSVVSTSTAVASYYLVSRNTVDYTSKVGWKLNLSFEGGQRSIADVLNFGQTVVISTVVPPNRASAVESCTVATGVTGYVYQLDANTGGNPDTGNRSSGRSSGFDVNGDGIGDGMGIAKAPGFPRGNVITRDHIGPRTEPPPRDLDNVPCDGSTAQGSLLGSGSSALKLVSTCGDAAFRRTWRQLINPPRIN